MTRAQDSSAFTDTRPDSLAQPKAYLYWCGVRNGRGQSELIKSGTARRMLTTAAQPKRIPADLKRLDATALEALRAQLLDDLDVAALLASLCLYGESAHEVWQAMYWHMECPDQATNEQWSAALYRLAAIDGALARITAANGAP